MDTEESNFSDSSNEIEDPPRALDGALDETVPLHSEEEVKPGVKSSKKASKKKNKNKKCIADIASLEML